jgi:flagellar FliJ protein
MFHFSLQPLLNHRKFVEKILKKELAESEMSLEAEKHRLLVYENQANRMIREMESKAEARTVMSEIHLYARSHQRLASETDRQHEKIADAARLSRQKRCRLVEAMKKRKVVDKLKEKRLKRYRVEINRQEQAFNNEIAVQQFNRKS